MILEIVRTLTRPENKLRKLLLQILIKLFTMCILFANEVHQLRLVTSSHAEIIIGFSKSFVLYREQLQAKVDRPRDLRLITA